MKLQNSFNFKTGPIVIEVTSNHEVDVIWLHDRYHHKAFAGGFLTHTQYEVPFGSKVHERYTNWTTVHDRCTDHKMHALRIDRSIVHISHTYTIQSVVHDHHTRRSIVHYLVN